MVSIDGDQASCVKNIDGAGEVIPVDELVAVAQFGEPIYPTLLPLDSVQNDDENGVWHTLIEADNYHALQLLEYLYPQKVDCIYIDPPYNTGARDWKYNNDYVDSADSYRHRQPLAMSIDRESGRPSSSKAVLCIASGVTILNLSPRPPRCCTAEPAVWVAELAEGIITAIPGSACTVAWRNVAIRQLWMKSLKKYSGMSRTTGIREAG